MCETGFLFQCFTERAGFFGLLSKDYHSFRSLNGSRFGFGSSQLRIILAGSLICASTHDLTKVTYICGSQTGVQGPLRGSLQGSQRLPGKMRGVFSSLQQISILREYHRFHTFNLPVVKFTPNSKSLPKNKLIGNLSSADWPISSPGLSQVVDKIKLWYYFSHFWTKNHKPTATMMVLKE